MANPLWSLSCDTAVAHVQYSLLTNPAKLVADSAQSPRKHFCTCASAAARHKDTIHFVAVSHSDRSSTDHWLASLPQSPDNGDVTVIVDAEREIFAQWGLGVSSVWHVLNPWSLLSVYRLGKEDGIYNRPTESGTRWQTSGSFAVDGNGKVTWSKPSASADEVPDFEDALRSLAM